MGATRVTSHYPGRGSPYNGGVNPLDQHHLGAVADPLNLTVAWLSQGAGYPLCREVAVESVFVTPDPKTSTLAWINTEVAGG
jgi:hypothetical protein